MSIVEAEAVLVDFLNECSVENGTGERRPCPVCTASRALYCPDCCQIVVPETEWPDVVREGSLQLPFKVDIMLDDRRASSTGIQAVTIAEHACRKRQMACPAVRLFELDKGFPECYPSNENTFFLFPGPSSVPLSSVMKSLSVDRLVLLDCKWTKTSSRTHRLLQSLQWVHLDFSFKQSYFWRWHTAGEGMLSTIEAVYVSTWEVATWLKWDKMERRKLVHLLWLFGLQRDLIRRKHELDGGVKLPGVLPFTEDGKQYQRNLRDRIRKEKRSDAHPE